MASSKKSTRKASTQTRKVAKTAAKGARKTASRGKKLVRSAKRAAMCAEVRRYIRVHLQDGALGPESIAAAHAMSVRALHALFEDTDESVCGLIRHERLARCHQDLALPSGGSVTEIAFRWGFHDAAHFARVFKQHYELTPSDVRRATLARAAALAHDGEEAASPMALEHGPLLEGRAA